MLTRNELKGSWAGVPVAWKEDLSFAEEAYRADVERVCRAGVPGVYTGGTTGEFYAMEFGEFQSVAAATVEECKRCGTPVMIGVTSTYTLGAQRRAAYAAELGADAIQVALPYWMEVDDCDVVGFMAAVASACPGLALTVYETKRSKKVLSLDQHRAIVAAVPAYGAVKANDGTLGCNPEGCAALSELVNVWVNEALWSELGPYGAIGCASALIYMNPRVVLRMFDLLLAQDWDELRVWTDRVKRLHVGLAPFTEKGFTDTAYDHMIGAVAGFMKMPPRSRGPYRAATEQDIAALRDWLASEVPELLQL